MLQTTTYKKTPNFFGVDYTKKGIATKVRINYTTFGAPMPGRSFTSSSYRYGFNGKENDSETGTQDYGMRIYNPALGKFLSVDPLSAKFAWNSTYAFAENDVIRSTDLDGLEKEFQIEYKDKSGTKLWHVVPYSQVHPGMDHGPLGKGEYVYFKDTKTGQFKGEYHATYSETNPIRSAAQNFDYRYQGPKGLKNAVKDAPVAAKVVGVVTVAVGAVSTAFGNPGGPAMVGAGIKIYEIADNVENATKVVEAAIDIKNKDYETGAAKLVGVGADILGGALVKPITKGDKVLEAVGTIGVDQTIDKITTNTDEMYTPYNKKE